MSEIPESEYKIMVELHLASLLLSEQQMKGFETVVISETQMSLYGIGSVLHFVLKLDHRSKLCQSPNGLSYSNYQYIRHRDMVVKVCLMDAAQ